MMAHNARVSVVINRYEKRDDVFITSVLLMVTIRAKRKVPAIGVPMKIFDV